MLKPLTKPLASPERRILEIVIAASLGLPEKRRQELEEILKSCTDRTVVWFRYAALNQDQRALREVGHWIDTLGARSRSILGKAVLIELVPGRVETISAAERARDAKALRWVLAFATGG